MDGSTQRPVFGGEAERIGTRLDQATDEFLKETKSCSALQIPPGQDQLTAMEFVNYLGINLQLEPELAWVAREMLAAPMPPQASMKVSKAGVVYFHDTVNDYYTIEHPLTQRYLKVLERQRLDLLCLRTKPSVNGLLFSQPDMLFHRQFRNLQIPCQSCGVMQSTLKCNQCLMSFCQSCADSLHKNALGPRKNHTFLTTACGSLCSTCAVKKPQVFCANCEDYFCFKCFEDMHRRGNRLQHKSMLVSVSDGDVIEPQKRCEECEDRPAAFACDYCLDNYCVQCFWKCHFNGHRRQHTASKVAVVPMCNQCQNVRATIFSEQTQELMCTECFTMLHAKGNRMLHLFMDSMDLLVLLERLDPAFQEHMRRARPRVLWALSQLQGWVKGIEARRSFRNRGSADSASLARCAHTAPAARHAAHAQVAQAPGQLVFPAEDAAERRSVKQKCSAMLAAKDVTTKAVNSSLRELRDTILQTASADPLEDENRTRETVQDIGTADGFGATTTGFPGAAQTLPSGISPYTNYEGSTRFNGALAATGPITMGGAGRSADLSNKDIRKVRDTTLRQITR
eukprot:CAMPEP_0115151048 /NCGR_PEP_ID=MMETSP0227-20121206/65383_1 /TAXON_ID=89957 /ORGANISM="Polarella glacialis, Strain CCMP 1383" /LENGTH=567 /DNA_ID=CAMNT_0002561491 /DNA_START=33 /DNA_END=1733 /DNA_ORIENTATION=-